MTKMLNKIAAKPAEAGVDNVVFLKRCRADFLARLAGHGIQDTDVVIANMRKSRNGEAVGYYSRMSQFRYKLRIVVDVAYIRAYYGSNTSMAEEEVMLTIAHEYGHAMAEAISYLASRGDPAAMFSVPDWQLEFENDEEAFAEDFARFCITYDAHHEQFWESYVPRYAADFNRLFLAQDVTPTAA